MIIAILLVLIYLTGVAVMSRAIRREHYPNADMISLTYRQAVVIWVWLWPLTYLGLALLYVIVRLINRNER